MNGLERAVALAEPRRRLGVVLLLCAALLWSAWPVITALVGRWSRDPRYSHGFLVIAFAIALLWRRRAFAGLPSGAAPSWWGVPTILLGEGLKLVGARYYVDALAGLSLLPSLAGVALLSGGWPLLRRASPAIAFLFFMIPLPYQVEVAVGYPLQRAATLASTYIIQTLGLTAVAEGNIILLDHARVGVAEACNGLGMLFMFSAFTVGAALILERRPVDKLLILLSTAPIAFAANVLRISTTAVLCETVGGKVAHVVYHDLAGWLMMPLAVCALWLELWVISHLFVERESPASDPVVLIPELVVATEHGIADVRARAGQPLRKR